MLCRSPLITRRPFAALYSIKKTLKTPYLAYRSFTSLFLKLQHTQPLQLAEDDHFRADEDHKESKDDEDDSLPTAEDNVKVMAEHVEFDDDGSSKVMQHAYTKLTHEGLDTISFHPLKSFLSVQCYAGYGGETMETNHNRDSIIIMPLPQNSPKISHVKYVETL